MPATFERTVPDGGRRMEGLPPPVTSRSMSVDGFRRILPEGLPSRMHEIHAEPGAAGSKSQYSSPSPLRAPQSRSGRRLSLPSKSPQELLAVQKSHLFFARLPPVTHGPLSDSPAAGATPARTRSLETILKKQAMSTRTRSLEGRFSWAAADESPSSTPSSSPWGDTLRSVVSSPERHAGKTLKPLPVRRNSVTKGQELPPGLRRWSHSEIVELQGGPRVLQHPKGVDGNLLIRTAAEFFDLINRHKFSEVADMLGKECKWKCSDESGRTHGREAIKQHLRDQMWAYPAMRWVLAGAERIPAPRGRETRPLRFVRFRASRHHQRGGAVHADRRETVAAVPDGRAIRACLHPTHRDGDPGLCVHSGSLRFVHVGSST